MYVLTPNANGLSEYAGAGCGSVGPRTAVAAAGTSPATTAVPELRSYQRDTVSRFDESCNTWTKIGKTATDSTDSPSVSSKAVVDDCWVLLEAVLVGRSQVAANFPATCKHCTYSTYIHSINGLCSLSPILKVAATLF